MRWDDRRQCLFFVDCVTQTLHWLENAEPPLHSFKVSGLPTGLVLAEDGRVVLALDDGLHVIDPDAETSELLSPYPEGLGSRANDANADLDGNLVTGTLNIGPGPGSYWWFSSAEGWRMLDNGIGNANGPVVLEADGRQTLVFADTLAGLLYAYPYDGKEGRVGERRVFGNVGELKGMPDGACADNAGGVWSCVLGSGLLARFTSDGLQQVIESGFEQPSDVTFGGKNLNRMFIVSITRPISGVEVTSPLAGALVALDDTGFRGRPEPRIRLGRT